MKQGSTDTVFERHQSMLAVDEAGGQAHPAAPRHKEPTECYDPYLLVDDEDWLIFMEPVLCENPVAADSLARLLFIIKEAIDSGPEGAARASFTLSDGIRLAYKYTEAHQAALKLYNLSLTGDLKPADEPQLLIRGAIKRAMAEISRATRARRAARAKRARRRAHQEASQTGTGQRRRGRR